MAIDLFVNFERYSNNSLFYRVTAASPTTYTVRLSDQSYTGEESTDALYRASYSLNGGQSTDFPVNSNGEFVLPIVLVTTSPCVCSISVGLTSIETTQTQTFQMSGKFLEKIPSIDFIAYPSLYIEPQTGYSLNLTPENYLSGSRGLFFYGEGHTETINLSSNNSLGAGSEVKWLVGNDLIDILANNYNNSYYPITPTSSQSKTATTLIYSIPDQEKTIPISVWLTSSHITDTGPVITYNDITGIPEYYPFFTSTITPTNEFYERTTFKSNIEVFRYPDVFPSLLPFPFEGESFFLPLDYSYKKFTVTTNAASKVFSDIVDENFVSTKWEISADPRKDSNVIGWSASTETLYGCKTYEFKLGYDTNLDDDINLLSFYQTTINYPTTVTLTVSSVKNVRINLNSDWRSRDVTFVNTVTASTAAVPSSKLYTPKFYNVKGETVQFRLVNTPLDPYTVLTATISSSNSSNQLSLTTQELTGTMTFNALGLTDIKAEIVYLNKRSNVIYKTFYTYEDAIEIIRTYDEIVDEKYFQTASTPLSLPYNEQPKITPNEWVTADAVNELLSKMYDTIESLYQYTLLYQEKYIFYGFLLPVPKTQINYVQGVVNARVLTWVDLDCTEPDVYETPTWADFECEEEEITFRKWDHQTTDRKPPPDPACFQRHCTRWNWKWRKKGKSEIDITWKDTKRKGQFEKKWKYEKCVYDTAIDCNLVSWNLSTDKTRAFVVPTSRNQTSCEFVDIDVLHTADKLVFARKQELYVTEKTYECKFVDRMIMADDTFTFQGIVGMTTAADEKIVVLDGVLPRVSVYEFVNNDIVLKDAWGKYGLQKNPLGFKQPTDIHIDKYNSVWIADSGNNCVKKFTIVGKPLLTLTHALFDEEGILSVCVDSMDRLHCLTSSRIVVFDQTGSYLFDYKLHEDIVGAQKINTSYNEEMLYVTYTYGTAKYFRNGIFSNFIMKDIVCADGNYLRGYHSITQDKFRNVYITAGDKILHVQDIQQTVQLKAPIKPELYWEKQELTVHKEEYVQPWVYLKSFHRLWDNIELLRNSIFYTNGDPCKGFISPTYKKEDIVIGQNEIVTNSVVNRITEQLWTNLQSLIKFFDPDCKK